MAIVISKVPTYDKNGVLETKLYAGSSFQFLVSREPEEPDHSKENIYLAYISTQMVIGIDFNAPTLVHIPENQNSAMFVAAIYKVYESTYNKEFSVQPRYHDGSLAGDIFSIMVEQEIENENTCDSNLFWEESRCGDFFKYHPYMYGDE